jgi:hypothetical protein
MSDTPLFSVLIGRASAIDNKRIIETLDALRSQEAAPSYEVIIPDRRLDNITDLIGAHYPEARIVRCGAGSSLPEMRTLAFEKACGEFIVVTEDHCVPPKNWLVSILEAFETAPERTVAVGGAVENGVGDTALDWATFLFEYSAFVPPVPSGPTLALPGMNVAYRRSCIAELDRSILQRGFWETTLHPLLSQKGFILYLSNQIRILHKKKFSFRLFAQQRFLYSRYYSGLRSSQARPATRWAMCGMSLALPALLVARALRNVMGKNQFVRQFAWALPYMIIFALIGACGELVGNVCGPGNALARIE